MLPHHASVAQRLGHLDDARKALIRYSVLVDDDRDQAARAAHIADLSLQLSDPMTAVVWYEKSESLGGVGASLLARLADAQARAGQLDKARATLQRAVEKGPKSRSALAVARRLQAR